MAEAMSVTGKIAGVPKECHRVQKHNKHKSTFAIRFVGVATCETAAWVA